MKFKIMLCVLFSVILTYNLAFAQNENDVTADQKDEEVTAEEDSVQESKSIKLNAIVITATKTKEKLKDVPVYVDVISKDDIKATGSNTLGDIIGQKVTGHYQRYSGLSQPAGIMANFTADQHGDDIVGDVLVLIDGHRLGTGNIGKIPTEIIERVEVIKGPSSALYGSAATGGVVNIITKKGRHKIVNTAKLEAGSFDYSRTALTSGGLINDYASYFVAASYMKTGNYKTKNYGEVFNTEETQSQIWSNLDLYFSDNQDLRIGMSYAGIISHYPEWKNYEQYTSYDNEANQYSDKSRGHADAEYNIRLLNNRLASKTSLYFLWDKNSWFFGSTSSGESIESDATIYNDKTIGGDQQFTISLIPMNTIVFGYTFENLKKESYSRTDGVESIPYTPDMSYMTNSVYAQDSLNILDRLNIVAGARYDIFKLSSTSDISADRSETYDNLSPRGGIVYKATDFMRVRANAGMAFKTPSASEMTMKHKTAYSNFMGNPDLKPETTTCYDSGIDFYVNYFGAGASYSYLITKDRITRIKKAFTDGDGVVWDTFRNIGKSEMEIINCYFNISIGSLLSLPIGIDLSSNLTINRRYEDMETHKKLPFVADREVKSNLQLSYNSLKSTLSHVYVGHEQISDTERKCSFKFFNLTTAYDLTKNISAEIDVFNLTNESYEWVDGYPMAERNFKIGLTGKF